MSAKVVLLPRNPAALAPAELSDSELADQLGEHERRYQVFKPVLDRRKELQEEAQRRCEKLPADKEAFFEGDLWQAKVHERSWETNLPPMDSVHRMFKAAKADFYSAVSMTLKSFKESLGEEKLKAVQKKTQTGYRRVTVLLKVSPNPAS